MIGTVRRRRSERNCRHNAAAAARPPVGKETGAMMRSRTLAFLALCLGLTPGRLAADAPLDAAALAARIDAHVNARLAEQGVKPVALADDAAFLRRVYLDLTGRIPRVADVRDFLDDKTPDKRARLIE